MHVLERQCFGWFRTADPRQATFLPLEFAMSAATDPMIRRIGLAQSVRPRLAPARAGHARRFRRILARYVSRHSPAAPAARPDRGDRGRRAAGRVSVQPGIQPAGALGHRAVSRPVLCRSRARSDSAQRRLTCGLLAMNGEQHRRNRRIVKEPFGLRAISTYGETIATADRRDARRLAARRRARHGRGDAAVHAARHQHDCCSAWMIRSWPIGWAT